MKSNSKMVAVTLILILLPCLFGLALWNRLPEQIPTHFNNYNQADGYSSKFFAVFGLPVLMAVLQLFCVFISSADPRRRNISPKLWQLVLFIIPVISLFVNIMIYGAALGYPVQPTRITNLLLGFLLIVIGNYMPKIKPNYTMGIKLPWTLSSESNWNRTHRMAGGLWMLCGIVLAVNVLFQAAWLTIAVLILITAIPTIYSYMIFKREGAEDEHYHY